VVAALAATETLDVVPALAVTETLVAVAALAEMETLVAVAVVDKETKAKGDYDCTMRVV